MGKRKGKKKETDRTGGCIIALLLFLFVLLLWVSVDETIPFVIIFFPLFFIALPFLLFKKAVGDEKNMDYVAMVTLIAVVMKADGQNTRSELKEVKAFLTKRFSEKRVRKILHLLKDTLQKDIRNTRFFCLQLNRRLSYAQRLDFLTLLFRIAGANGEICQYEAVVITQIANYINIRNSDFVELTEQFSTFYNYKKRQETFVYQSDNNWAYNVLMIDKNATMEEVKRAYRRLAMLHHPDKVAPHDSVAQAQAAEKFRKINEAYRALIKR